MEEMRTVHKILVGKPEGKRTIGRPSHRWEDNRMDPREIVWEVDWIHVAQDRDQWETLGNMAINLQVP
jgi:hypothetical protein